MIVNQIQYKMRPHRTGLGFVPLAVLCVLARSVSGQEQDLSEFFRRQQVKDNDPSLANRDPNPFRSGDPFPSNPFVETPAAVTTERGFGSFDRTTTISNFGRPRTQEDEFNRFSTEDPFRREQEAANRFQNNERGGSRPTDIFRGSGIRTRPQVDEFGNPLDDIRSVDTTRFELGEGVNANEVTCPRNWVRYKDNCYKFTRSPIKRWDDARLICQAYRHQDQVK